MNMPKHGVETAGRSLIKLKPSSAPRARCPGNMRECCCSSEEQKHLAKPLLSAIRHFAISDLVRRVLVRRHGGGAPLAMTAINRTPVDLRRLRIRKIRSSWA